MAAWCSLRVRDGFRAAFATGVALGLATAAPPAAADEAGWIGPQHSGSWYTPGRSGEGFVVEVLDNGQVLAVWFTYPPAGSTARQAWVFAQDGVIDGDRVVFPTVFTTRGPRFGPGYDPAALTLIPWGSLSLRFSGCDTAVVDYAGPTGWGSGSRALVRLTGLDELGCDGKRRLTPAGARALTGLRQRSGAWYDPAHTGEGWFVEDLADDRALAYWFTYDADGEQAWTYAEVERQGPRYVASRNYRPVGTRFGADFDSTAITLSDWGSYTLAFAACNGAALDYASSQPGFGSGHLVPTRLTRLAGTACVDGTPTAPAGGSWTLGPPMPIPQSEVATAVLDGRVHLAGGYGLPSGVQRFDPASARWDRIADLPGARDHALAVAIDGDLLVTGGFANSGQGDQVHAGWRYRSAAARWETPSALPFSAASGAAALDGFAWFGNEDGSLSQYDPRHDRRRDVPADASAVGRDHSQLIAFQGELWLIGGRSGGSGETREVAIFDPASRRWRRGPRLDTSRAGFAVAADATTLVVAGGEVIYDDQLVRNQVEAIAAGEDAWTPLPPMPFAVHGVGGAILDNAFYALGGSSLAGGIRNAGRVQVYRWPTPPAADPRRTPRRPK